MHYTFAVEIFDPQWLVAEFFCDTMYVYVVGSNSYNNVGNFKLF